MMAFRLREHLRMISYDKTNVNGIRFWKGGRCWREITTAQPNVFCGRTISGVMQTVKISFKVVLIIA